MYVSDINVCLVFGIYFSEILETELQKYVFFL